MEEKKISVENIIIAVISVAMCLFHLYTAVFGIFPTSIQRSVHLGFVMMLVYLIKPIKFKKLRWLDYVCAVAGGWASFFVCYSYDRYCSRIQYVSPVETLDYIACIVLIVLLLEGTRRTCGIALPIIAMVFMAYCFTGPWLPGILNHRMVSLRVFVENMYMAYEGIFGSALGSSATFLFLFILFGSCLEKVGTGEYFINLANRLVGWSRGGPAKAAVVSSAIFGSISGSAVANVYGTGVMTIPLMKKLDYDPVFAGATEAVSSTGGQILPPVMGAAAFVMAEFLGLTYLDIVKAAAIPGVMYYVALLFMVHLRARKQNLKPMKEGFVSTRYLFQNSYLMIPLAILIIILVMGYTAFKAVYLSLLSLLLIGIITRRVNLKKLLEIFIDGAKSAVTIALACGVSGIIVGVLTTTGLGVTFTSIVLSLSKGILPLALLMTAVACIILGMGVPTTAAYVIVSALCAPILIKMGVMPIAAHMFVFYFAVISAITPPVALAAYAGAHIAGCDMMKTGIQATKLGISAFLMPFMFVYSPALLMEGSVPQVLGCIATCTIGAFAIAMAVEGYLIDKLDVVSRVVSFAAAILLIDQGFMTDMVGICLLVAVILIDKLRSKKNASMANG